MNSKPIPTPASLSQQGRLSFLLNDSVLYGGAAAVGKASALITFPLLARNFSVVEYGVVDFFLVLIGFLAIAIVFGQDSAVARYFYEFDDSEKRKQLISQSLLWQLVTLAFLLPLLWWKVAWVTDYLIKAPDSERLFRLVLLQLPFLVLINFSQNLLKWTFARSKFLIMSIGFTTTHASLLTIAILMFEIGVDGVLLVGLCTSMVFGCLGLFLVRDWLVKPTDLQRLREMLPFAIPYGIIGCIAAFSPTLERALTDQVLGGSELGLYAAGSKLAMLIGLVVSAFQTAWGPFSLALHKQPDAAQTFNWVLKIFSLGICFLVFLISILAQPVITLLASGRYTPAAIVVFPLVMGLAIQATSWITEIGIGLSKRSYLSLYSYSVFMAATSLSILLLAPILGLVGVALGVMIGHILKALVSSTLAQRAYPLPWDYKPIVWLFCYSLSIGLIGIWVGNLFDGGFYTAAMSLGAVSMLTFGWFMLFTREEQRDAQAMINSIFKRGSTRP